MVAADSMGSEVDTSFVADTAAATTTVGQDIATVKNLEYWADLQVLGSSARR